MKTKKNKPKRGAVAEPSEPRTVQIEGIGKRAYELYLERGGEHGRALDDWVQAEREILESGRKAEKDS